jgi:hypothetical protein
MDRWQENTLTRESNDVSPIHKAASTTTTCDISTATIMKSIVALASVATVAAFTTSKIPSTSSVVTIIKPTTTSTTPWKLHMNRNDDNTNDDKCPQAACFSNNLQSILATLALSAALSGSVLFGGPSGATASEKAYDGFADYAKENQMQQSDVSCFVTKCKEQTINLFKQPRGIKGITCLGRCKGEQACATRCFAEFGSEDLNNWLSCTIEENECVKVPKNIDNSAENVGYTTTVKNFDPKSLVGTWYKTDGLNPNYDLFDCQTNTFAASESDGSELDMGIFLRVRRPEEAGGGYWENELSEHMVVDAVKDGEDAKPGARTMHTQGKMYGLQFEENWYILGESDGKNDIPPFKLVAYKGHTLQGNYEGSFVYAKEPRLPESAIPAVREAAAKAGLNWDDFQHIDNTW